MEAGPCRFLESVCVVGSSGVGKTTLIERFCFGNDAPDEASAKSLYNSKAIELGAHKVELSIIENQGDPLNARDPLYFASAFLFVFAADDMSSFEYLKKPLEIFSNMRKSGVSKPALIVANKVKRGVKQAVSMNDLLLLSRSSGVDFVTCSTLTPEEATVPFARISRDIISSRMIIRTVPGDGNAVCVIL